MNMDEKTFAIIKDADAIILDLDGVITQTARVHANAWKQMFDEYREKRLNRGEEAYQPFSIENDYPEYLDGKPRYDGVRSFLEAKGIHLPEGTSDDKPDEETICGLGNRKNQKFLELVDEQGVDVFEDSVEQVKKWREQGKKTAVVSSSKNCGPILKSAQLTHLFDVRVDGITSVEENLTGKPAPDIFLYAAKKLGVEPDKLVVVEDAPSGVEAGSKGNFSLVVGIAKRGQDELLMENGADVVVHSLRELNDQSQSNKAQKRFGDLPSALEQQKAIFKELANKKPAIFLDYDGTLSPIVKRPEDAILSDEMKQVLQKLATLCTLAIVSGRDRADVENLVGLKELIYAGSHGFDITGPNNMHLQYEGGKDCLPDLDAAEQELNIRLDNVPGAQVERKKFSVAVHYRNVPEEHVAFVKKTTTDVLNMHSKLREGLGKKIIELKPDIEWDKGKAVFWLLEKLNLNKPEVVPIYIGDDLTDEDAFRALVNRGLGILVGDHGEPTFADYKLIDVEEVRKLLSEMIKHLENSSS